MTMKLSEAIRLGAMLRPQRYGEPCDGITLIEQSSLCALAGAAAVVGEHVLDVSQGVWAREWSPVRDTLAACPVMDGPRCHFHAWATVTSIVAHLNDRHQWTRERIADWVATVEPVEQSTDGEASSLRDAVDVHVRVSVG